MSLRSSPAEVDSKAAEKKGVERVQQNAKITSSGGPSPDGESYFDDGVQKQTADTQQPSGFTFVVLTIGLMTVVLVVALDNYIIPTAIPKLTTDFKNLNLVGWYGSSYFLTLMSFQPAFGQLCTIFPIKRVYLVSIAIFEVGSIISASAPTSGAFIAGRLVSGAASGGLWCGTLTVMAQAVPVHKRHFYVSVVTSMYGAASAAGPLLGGVFTDSRRLTWRFCFWVNLPIGFLAFVIIAIYLKPPHPPDLAVSLTLREKIGRIDLLGIVLLLGGFACLLLALQWGGTTFEWSDPKVWGFLLGFGLMTVTFIAVQIRLKDKATIPYRIVAKRTASAGCAFTVFMSMAIGVHVYYLPFYFQLVLGTTASQSGVRTLPYLMSLLFTPMITGSLITLVGYYVPFMLVGCTLMTVGSGFLYTLSPNATSGHWIGYQFLAAFGAGLCRQIAFSAVPLVLVEDDLATASALVAFCNSLGPTMAIGIGQSIFTNTFERQAGSLPGIDVKVLVNKGATDLKAVIPANLLVAVKLAFNQALTQAFVLSIASAGAALCCSLAMEWINVKKKH